MDRQILHVDVNNAFLSWTAVEKLNNGETVDIRNIPAIIGGDESKRRGVVLAKSNIAKQFGIKTGEPIYFARKKCNKLQVFMSDYSIYKKYSDKMYNILLDYTDIIERFSIDECFMDLTKFIGKNEKILDKAKEISARIKNELGFTVNIGISTNKVLAKMASDFQKPDKIHTLYKSEIKEKMWKLPISDLFMVGRRSLPKLNKLGIITIGDLAKSDYKQIVRMFGKFGKMIWEYSNGIDDSEVINTPDKPKGIGHSITLPYDYSEIEKLEEVLLVLTEQVCFRLRKIEMVAKVVNVQIKNNKFEVSSHQRKLDVATSSTRKIYEEAKKLLKELYKGIPIRLIGIRVDNLCMKNEMQLSMFDVEIDEKQEKLNKTLDSIKEKYGYEIISKAGELNIKRNFTN